MEKVCEISLSRSSEELIGSGNWQGGMGTYWNSCPIEDRETTEGMLHHIKERSPWYGGNIDLRAINLQNNCDVVQTARCFRCLKSRLYVCHLHAVLELHRVTDGLTIDDKSTVITNLDHFMFRGCFGDMEGNASVCVDVWVKKTCLSHNYSVPKWTRELVIRYIVINPFR